jgi:hypothetical protein
MTKGDRPGTFADCLADITLWLDATDKYINTFGPAVRQGLATGNGVQQDLRRLAAALADHPELDAQIMALITTKEQ